MLLKHCLYVFIGLTVLLTGCKKNPKPAEVSNSTKECNSSANDSIPLDGFPYKEKEITEISEFDRQFIHDIFAQEKIVIKKEDFRLKKTFLLTGIENVGDSGSHLEMFVYEVLLNDKHKHYTQLSEKLKGEEYVQLYPETKAPHTCYLFMNGDIFFVIGYYGLPSYYEPFDITPFISAIKNRERH